MVHINEVLVAQNYAIIQLLMEITNEQDDDTSNAIERANNAAQGWLEQVDQTLADDEGDDTAD